MTAILDDDLNVIARNVDPSIYLSQSYYNEGKWIEYIDRPTYEVDMYSPFIIIIRPTWTYLEIVNTVDSTKLQDPQFHQSLQSNMCSIPHELLAQLYRDVYPSNTHSLVLTRFHDETINSIAQTVIQVRDYTETELHEIELAMQDSIEAMILFSYQMQRTAAITTKSGLTRHSIVRNIHDSMIDIDIYDDRLNLTGRAAIRKEFISMISIQDLNVYDVWLMHLESSSS